MIETGNVQAETLHERADRQRGEQQTAAEAVFMADPQVQHLGIAWPMQHPQLGEVALVGQPFRLSRNPREAQPRPAPHQGDQTDAILHELGYDDARIAELRAALVV